MTHSWYENTARGRIEALLDAGSFEEFLPATGARGQPASAPARHARRLR